MIFWQKLCANHNFFKQVIYSLVNIACLTSYCKVFSSLSIRVSIILNFTLPWRFCASCFQKPVIHRLAVLYCQTHCYTFWALRRPKSRYWAIFSWLSTNSLVICRKLVWCCYDDVSYFCNDTSFALFKLRVVLFSKMFLFWGHVKT